MAKKKTAKKKTAKKKTAKKSTTKRAKIGAGRPRDATDLNQLRLMDPETNEEIAKVYRQPRIDEVYAEKERCKKKMAEYKSKFLELDASLLSLLTQYAPEIKRETGQETYVVKNAKGKLRELGVEATSHKVVDRKSSLVTID